MASPSGSSGSLWRLRERGRLIREGALLGGAGNVLLTGVKLIGGALFGSEALVADGIHSASDVAASVAVAIGVRVARVPADRDHPYGHEKAEVIAQNLVGILLILAGAQLIVASYRALRAGPAVPPTLTALWVALGSLVLKELLYRQNQAVGRRFGSEAMLALATDHRLDVWASLAAGLGILGARLGHPALDPLAGAVVAVLVVRAGWGLVVRAVESLMDEFDDPSTLAALRRIVLGIEGVCHVEGIRARRMGGSILIDVEVAVPGDLTVRAGHAVAARVKAALKSERPEVEAVHVHVDPDPPTGEGPTTKGTES